MCHGGHFSSCEGYPPSGSWAPILNNYKNNCQLLPHLFTLPLLIYPSTDLHCKFSALLIAILHTHTWLKAKLSADILFTRRPELLRSPRYPLQDIYCKQLFTNIRRIYWERLWDSRLIIMAPLWWDPNRLRPRAGSRGFVKHAARPASFQPRQQISESWPSRAVKLWDHEWLDKFPTEQRGVLIRIEWVMCVSHVLIPPFLLPSTRPRLTDRKTAFTNTGKYKYSCLAFISLKPFPVWFVPRWNSWRLFFQVQSAQTFECVELNHR